MKNKTILIIDILVLLFCAGVIIYEFAFADTINAKTVAKVSVLFVTFSLAMLKIRPKRSALDQKIYADAYKSIICGAFSNDKRSYGKLINAIVDFNYSRFDKAVKTLDILLKISCASPDDYSAVLNFKALCLEEQGLENEAIETYEELLRYDISRSNAWSNLGLLYSKKGDFNNAENSYINAIKYDPENAYGYSNISVLYFKKGDNEKALEYALKAIELKPNMYQPMSTLSLCYKILGDSDKSEKYRNLYIINGGEADVINQALENIRA
ncbi:MAG: tetratricopeptide repeat protein [Clostridium sp.]|nr:tetratricopeptide repeat protein [Clostridium sp.]MCM1546776.1 tetratricopeptide repeat protein [Ruminococcus sp.]